MKTFEKQHKKFVKLALKLIHHPLTYYRFECDDEYAALYMGRNKKICFICNEFSNSGNKAELQKLRDLVEELG